MLYLHGFPGLLGGLCALFAVKGIHSGAQIKGILVTVFIALIAGLIVGKIVSLAPSPLSPYEDSAELDV